MVSTPENVTVVVRGGAGSRTLGFTDKLLGISKSNFLSSELGDNESGNLIVKYIVKELKES